MVRPAAVCVGADDRDLVRQRRVVQGDDNAVVVRVAHRIAEYGGEHGDAVLLLAIHADQRGLAVAFGLTTEQRDGGRRNLAADGDAGLGEGGEVRLVAPCKRIFDDGDGRDLAQRRHGAPAGLLPHLAHECHDTLDHAHTPFAPAASYVDRASGDKGRSVLPEREGGRRMIDLVVSGRAGRSPARHLASGIVPGPRVSRPHEAAAVRI